MLKLNELADQNIIILLIKNAFYKAQPVPNISFFQSLPAEIKERLERKDNQVETFC